MPDHQRAQSAVAFATGTLPCVGDHQRAERFPLAPPTKTQPRAQQCHEISPRSALKGRGWRPRTAPQYAVSPERPRNRTSSHWANHLGRVRQTSPPGPCPSRPMVENSTSYHVYHRPAGPAQAPSRQSPPAFATGSPEPASSGRNPGPLARVPLDEINRGQVIPGKHAVLEAIRERPGPQFADARLQLLQVLRRVPRGRANQREPLPRPAHRSAAAPRARAIGPRLRAGQRGPAAPAG